MYQTMNIENLINWKEHTVRIYLFQHELKKLFVKLENFLNRVNDYFINNKENKYDRIRRQNIGSIILDSSFPNMHPRYNISKLN